MTGDDARRAGTPDLSLVIPAYNEAHRIEETLRAADQFLDGTNLSAEVILADDGSSDDTRAIAERYASTHPRVRVVSIPHAGKAAALRAGMTAAEGALVAFTDADLATPLSYLTEFVRRAQAGADVVIGSREGSGAERVDEPAYRHLMGRVFNRLVQILVLPGIDDTQCGFKLFRRDCLRDLLGQARLYRDATEITGARVTAFDVELLAIAKRRRYRIEIVPVVWRYGDRSKVNPLRDTAQNLSDILAVARHARRGDYDR